jgi:predicted nucleotidyltransferase
VVGLELREALRALAQCEPVLAQWLALPEVWQNAQNLQSRLQKLLQQHFAARPLAHYYTERAASQFHRAFFRQTEATRGTLWSAYLELLRGRAVVGQKQFPAADLHILRNGEGLPESLKAAADELFAVQWGWESWAERVPIPEAFRAGCLQVLEQDLALAQDLPTAPIDYDPLDALLRDVLQL